jgi:uncharacterized membrane protein YdjX (TVP38/TMEM64 family)
LFAVVWGSIYVSVAATLAILIGRYFVRQWVAARLANYPKFKAVDETVARQGWKIVALTRLSPVFPFNLLNYAFSLTNVGVRDYVLASWVGTLPGTIPYVYLGSLAGDLKRVATGGTQRSAAEWALYAIGLLATIAVTVYITRVSNRALKVVSWERGELNGSSGTRFSVRAGRSIQPNPRGQRSSVRLDQPCA